MGIKAEQWQRFCADKRLSVDDGSRLSSEDKRIKLAEKDADDYHSAIAANRAELTAKPPLEPRPTTGPGRCLPLNIDDIYALYLQLGSVHKVGPLFGVTGDTIHQHLKKAGKKLNHSKWTEAELSEVRAAYAVAATEGVNLAILSNRIGRTYAGIACKAEELGLTAKRGCQTPTKEHRENNIKASKGRWSRHPHPKGMRGKKHTDATKEAISKAGMGREVKPETMDKVLRTRFERYGTIAPNVKRGSWKAGWREIGGKRIFARSMWEANYARYLQFLKENGEIQEWEHEPETFWFEKIKRGSRSYLPDFRVTSAAGVEYHEVKGWMCSRSKTKIRRMALYHPTVKLRVIQAPWFRDANRILSGLIPDWETKPK